MNRFYHSVIIALTVLTLSGGVLAQGSDPTKDDPSQVQIVPHDNPPPPPKAETPGKAPDESKYWIQGNWQWKPGNSWVWRPGVWVARPNPYAHWTPGHWAWRPYGNAWIPGHWGW